MKINKQYRLWDDTRIILMGKGILVGLLAGFIVSLFRLAIGLILKQVKIIYLFLTQQPQWLIGWILLSVVLAIFLGNLIHSEPNIKGSGIPQVEGQLQGTVELHWWPVLWKKFIGGILAIGSGLFLGREGPSIQLGAMTGQGVNQLFKGKRMDEKILLSSGASAGLSAAFNAPLAGLLFVLEEVHHNFSPLIGLTSLASAVTANFVSLNFFGLKPILDIGSLTPLPLSEYGHLLVLGFLLGLFGLMYQKVLLLLPHLYGKIPCLSAKYYSIVPFLLIIPIGLFAPDLLGGGNELIIQLGLFSPTIGILASLFILRFIFSMVSYGSQLPGGIFLPILTLGAILGSLYGNLAVEFVGMDPIYISSFIVLSMAGYFTAIGKAPLTAIILVTEMVGSLNQLMPLAVVSLVSYTIADLTGAKPIYEALLERLVGKDRYVLKGRKEIIEVTVQAESILDGGMIRDFKWPKEALLTSIRRGESEIITHGDTVMHLGDTLIILTDEGVAQKVREQIKEMSEHKDKRI